jgi:propionate CoA-transferase
LSFNAARAFQSGQRVLYVTERAVFELSETSIQLVEVAPGVDAEREILSRSEAKIKVGRDPKEMPREIFTSHKMSEVGFAAS